MRSVKNIVFTFILLAPVLGYSQKEDRKQELQLLADNVFHLSEVMLHDVANPPAASRFYAYAMLGAYETALSLSSGGRLADLNTKLNVNPAINTPPAGSNLNLSFCANYAMLEVGRMLMPSGPMLEEKQQALIKHFRDGRKITAKNMPQHIAYAQEIARQVVQYARADDYNKLSAYARYRPMKDEGHWYPTPPEYMGAVEPRWSTVRAFFLDSAAQFAPLAPMPYSKDSTSAFYRQMKEVYTTVKNITPEQRAIASFWDCNPFAVTYSGHMAIGLKKISPGGHWMGITGIACKQANLALDSAILVHTLVALTLHDAFISCWQEKYNSHRIRPETAINKLIDSSWRPLLQTPPFPEYTSGHSVVSSAVSVVLTYLLGDNFGFTDTSEVYFGIPERKFKSFYQAANEAAVSRLYGGIHFRDACEQGAAQGKRVGQFVISSAFDVKTGHE
ncbi:vanadium-dependent haloperoxidase [Fulvivirgaceae bacterium PWU4]|uniref:Vanadium-dependent haloperoxidase n=1 Tax=Chryseosolibacter histidini TaxID=2782349 RepID=A0AAP2DFJ6_9BACT|nr:vanadium-dependent haloperoxidase [Chryseosolibacter histidini]MBT1695280.1 vanadium-dependent haloperoxidase [Chryseosolibacter histidini]